MTSNLFPGLCITVEIRAVNKKLVFDACGIREAKDLMFSTAYL